MVLETALLDFIPALLLSFDFAHSIDCSADPTGDRAELEKHIELCRIEIELDKARLSNVQVKRTKTEADIQVINYNLKRKVTEIRRKDLKIYELSNGIERGEDELLELQKELLSHIKVFEGLMRKSNESERYRITDILLTDTSVSEFLSRIYQHQQVREEIKILVASVETIQLKIALNIEVLDGKKQEEVVLKVYKETEKNEIEAGRVAKKRLLKSQLNTEKGIYNDIETKQKQIAKIKSVFLIYLEAEQILLLAKLWNMQNSQKTLQVFGQLSC